MTIASFKKKALSMLAIMAFTLVITYPAVALAQNQIGPQPLPIQSANLQAAIGGELTEVQRYSGLRSRSPEFFVGTVIRGFLGVLGFIALLLLIYGGARWMLSRGNDQEVEVAKKILISAFIGLIIVIAAYMITYYVVSLLERTV